MGHLFYTELGNKGFRDMDGSVQASGYGLVKNGPFKNLVGNGYWSGTEYLPSTHLWYFNFSTGEQDVDLNINSHHVLAVHDGNFGAPVPTGIVHLPKTGQMDCYDASGNVISCAGTGQDGEIQAGAAWPDPRFTDNGDATITDNLTGFMWTKDGNSPGPAVCSPGGQKTLQGALDYVKCLNTNNYLGYSDWRLPNINELKSLINRQQEDSATWLNSQGFSNVQVHYYWSSTTCTDGNYSAWYVYFRYGNVGTLDKSSSYYVRAVRAGQSGASGSSVISLPKTGQTTCYDASGTVISCAGTGQDGELQMGVAWPEPRFNDNQDQTVTDKLTSLMWTKDATTPGPIACDPGGQKTWQGALDYVKCLNTNNYLGYSDWRLPNINELISMFNWQQVDSATWLNSQGFSGVQSSYWSSTTHASDNYFAWIANFGNRLVYGDNKSSHYYVRAVREGQSTATNTLTLSKSGSGTVTSNPEGINCGSTCSASFTTGTSVVLMATPDAGASFTGWSGACSGTQTTCAVTMNGNQNVSASFTTVDNTAPSITSATSTTSDGAYFSGSAVNITLNFSEAVSSIGLTITLNTSATINTGALSNAGSWSGTYTIAAGQTTADLTISSITGMITDASSNSTTNPTIPSGQNIGDKKAIVIALNGVCGSANGGTFVTAPTSNLCAYGTASAVTGSGSWAWACTGINGGTQAICTASAFVVTKPTADTTPVTDATATTATLKGVINPNGAATAYYFQYSTEETTNDTSVLSLPAGTAAQAVEIPVTGLLSNTTYYYRIVAENSAGTIVTPNRSFKTLSAPNTRKMKVIIVAGGSPTSANVIWNATKKAADNAYTTLIRQGIDKSRIRYLSQSIYDADGDGTTDVYALASSVNLEEQLTTWAATDTEDVLLYMVDHGGKGYFVIREGEQVSANNLKTWLDTLQQYISGRVLVIYDACYAGSFISVLNPPPAGKERIVVSSTSDVAESVFLTNGTLSFSNLFWNELNQGNKFYHAYLSAKKSMEGIYRQQVSQIDVNGNGSGNEKEDTTLALNIQIGNEVGFGALPPTIGSVSPEQSITGTEATLYADNVTVEAEIQRVWAVITPPNLSGSGSGAALTDADLPTVDLVKTTDNRWEINYNQFTQKGTYTITIFAMDSTFVVSQPLSTSVNTSSGSLYANFTNAGIWKYSGTGTNWQQVTASNPDLLVTVGATLYGTFPGLGIWKFDGTNWEQTTTSVPAQIVGTATTLYGAFTGLGIWKWDGTTWAQTTASNPQTIIASTSDLYGTFPGLGIWKWNGTAWSNLTSSIPDKMVTSGIKLYGAFSGLGIWLWNGTQWEQATSSNPQLIAANSAKLYGSFAGAGIWEWDGASSWKQISPDTPTQMTASGTELYAAFTGVGTKKWDGTTWSLISGNEPAGMVVGE